MNVLLKVVVLYSVDKYLSTLQGGKDDDDKFHISGNIHSEVGKVKMRKHSAVHRSAGSWDSALDLASCPSLNCSTGLHSGWGGVSRTSSNSDENMTECASTKWLHIYHFAIKHC